jgi:peptidoglycan/LPS O-acetylase OafA/YrhL
MEHPVFNFLEKISYGIYLIHQPVIFYFAKLINIVDIVLLLNIGLAYFLNEFFEKNF